MKMMTADEARAMNCEFKHNAFKHAIKIQKAIEKEVKIAAKHYGANHMAFTPDSDLCTTGEWYFLLPFLIDTFSHNGFRVVLLTHDCKKHREELEYIDGVDFLHLQYEEYKNNDHVGPISLCLGW